jgi:hypothetical protein
MTSKPETTKSTNPPVTTELIPEHLAGSAEAWRLCDGSTGASLLRLAILRELLRSLHAEKSRCLATGKKTEAQQFRQWETRIENLRQGVDLKGELADLLRDGPIPKKRTRLIPQALLSVLTRERLERYDRKWEAEIAAEACSLGWRFWTLKAWVSIPLAEDWNRRLSERLWPNGVVLFIEAIDHPAPGPPADTGPSESLWQGQWTILLQPSFTPQDLSLDFDRWRLAALCGEEILLEMLEAAPEIPREAGVRVQAAWFSGGRTPGPSPYAELEGAVRELKLSPVLTFHLWAYPTYRRFIESKHELSSRLSNPQAAIDASLEAARQWLGNLPIVAGELRAQAERAAEVPWIRFRTTVLKDVGQRPIGVV